jgi:hypothetical protein
MWVCAELVLAGDALAREPLPDTAVFLAFDSSRWTGDEALRLTLLPE